jgi:hypothetical protein
LPLARCWLLLVFGYSLLVIAVFGYWFAKNKRLSFLDSLLYYSIKMSRKIIHDQYPASS